MEQRRLSRRELYDLVWSMPMTKLAPQFGISDVALRKRCQHHDIPTPGLGYWAQLAAGHQPEKPDLPLADTKLDDIVMNAERAGSNSPRPSIPVVVVDKKLSEPHSLVTWLERKLEKAEADAYGRLIVGPTWSPEAVLQAASRSRALLLLDALAKALEQRGHRVQARLRGEHATCEDMLIDAFEEELAIQLEEKLARKPHVLTPEERREKERWEKSGWGPWDRAPKYDYYADGDLKLSLRFTHYKYQGRKSWSDTKTQRLDDLLGHAVVAIEAAAQLGRHEHLEAERLARLRHEAERKRLRGERLAWYRRRLADELEDRSAAWRKAAEIREFLGAYDRALPASERGETAEKWVAAARKYAEKLDPLTNAQSIARDLEPSDEVLEELLRAEEEDGRANG